MKTKPTQLEKWIFYIRFGVRLMQFPHIFRRRELYGLQ